MFEEIIGHEKIKEFFEKSIANNRLAHAYLFIGPHNVGKKTFARFLAKELLSQKIELEAHPDVTIISRICDEKTGKPKLEIAVDQIRELNTRLSHTALFPSWKIAIIEDADTMSTQTANALLKTLEEPKGKTLIILLASNEQRILPTIKSRTQSIRFSLVKQGELVGTLLKKGYDDNEARKLSSLALGRPGIALSFADNPETYNQWKEALKTRAILLSDPEYMRLRWIDKNTKGLKPEDMERELYAWRIVLRDALLAGLGIDENRVLEESGKVNFKQVYKSLTRLTKTEDALRQHVDPRLAFQYFLTPLG